LDLRHFPDKGITVCLLKYCGGQILNSIALVVATHDGTENLNKISSWILNQKPWKGYLIVIGSGSTDHQVLEDVCKAVDINFVFEKSLNCGLAKRNIGANLARDLGHKFVTFLNDYQRLTPNALQNFELENHDEDVVFGNIEFDRIAGITNPRISSLNVPLSKKSSNREVWGIFSSVSEAGMLIKLDTFIDFKGWQYPNLNGRTYLGGDGMLLTSRIFVDGGTFGYSKNYTVLGGHKNVNVTKEMFRSKSAVYPYAFTLSTKLAGVPRWISFRFIFGRLARSIGYIFSLNFHDLKLIFPELESRLRGLAGLKPSKKSKLLDDVFEYNCKSSDYYCARQGATECIPS